MPKEINRLLKVLCRYGLRVKAEDLVPRHRKRQKAALERLLEDGYTVEEITDAIIYGMPNVWPFSEDGGRVFDAHDLERNMLKALGEAGKKHKRGQVPLNAQSYRGPE